MNLGISLVYCNETQNTFGTCFGVDVEEKGCEPRWISEKMGMGDLSGVSSG